MSFRITHSLAIVALLSAGASARAQSFSHIGVAAGASIPRSGFADRATTGYDVALSLDVHAPLTPLSLRVEGMYDEFDYSSNPASIGSVFRQFSQSARIIGVSANGILAGTGTFSPYGIGGVGYYHRTEADPTTAGTRDDNAFGGNLGGGVRFELSGFAAYVEARYHWVGNTDVRFVPITFGVVF